MTNFLEQPLAYRKNLLALALENNGANCAHKVTAFTNYPIAWSEDAVVEVCTKCGYEVVEDNSYVSQWDTYAEQI